MESTFSRIHRLVSLLPLSNLPQGEKSRHLTTPTKPDDLRFFPIHAVRSLERSAASWIPNHRAGRLDAAKKIQNLNLESPLGKSGRFSTQKQLENLNSKVSPHRAVSAVRLLRIDQGGAFADLLNDKGVNSAENEMRYVERTLGFHTRALDDRDIRLVTDIVGGVVRWKRYLDHLIMSLCDNENKFRGMEPLLLQILRIGFYEILKLDMPPYAVVDENVRLAKVALRPGAGNMVNGILRKLLLLKEEKSLPLPKLEGDERAQARALATIYSHPVHTRRQSSCAFGMLHHGNHLAQNQASHLRGDHCSAIEARFRFLKSHLHAAMHLWMVRRWIKYLGVDEAMRLMIWNNSDPSFSLRASTGRGFTRADLVERLKILQVPHELSSHMDDFVRIKTGMQTVIQAGLLKEGLCLVQDESAGLVVSVVDAQPGETIVDCCAAPGGKTLFMASRLRGQGVVSAIDINKGRLRILEETAKLHDVSDVITVVHADLRTFSQKASKKSDKVLLDAPCSGLGVLSKRADLRWNRRFEDMEQLTNLQDKLLDAASLLVKPGGTLVYSTCSIDPEENEERVAAFLLKHPEFNIDPVDRYVPSDFITDQGFFFSNPVKHSLDGSFAARMVRSAEQTNNPV